MTTDELHDRLNQSENLSGYEDLLREYLVSQVKRYDEGQDNPETIAYEMAGLMSARSLNGLSNDAPFMQVLLMAGELELPEPHRSSPASWEELKRLVASLPR